MPNKPARMTLFLLSLLVLPIRTANADDGAGTTDLSWLAGHWVEESWDGDPAARRGEEHWLAPTANLMLGINRTLEGDRTRAFEYLRIEITPDGARYLASPGGRPATAFALIESGPRHAVFENPDHDFPQRIRYRRVGDRLEASIEGTVDGEKRSMSWGWRLSSAGREGTADR